MAQYKTGTVSVTNGSNAVTVTGATADATAVAVGDSFKVDRAGEAIYQIASRTPASGASLTALTLSVTYGGTTGSGLGYQLATDYTPNRAYPELAQGDAAAADWITRALRMIDADMPGLTWRGAWATATVYNVNDAVQRGILVATYRCKLAHTSGASTEPGVGASWQTYWELIADHGGSGTSGAGAWRGTWATATSYLVLDAVAGASGAGLGKSYVCKSAHTSGATTEPGVGASWTTVWDLLADKGATGPTGPTGAAGVSSGLSYLFDATTTDADPGIGNLRLNNATLSLVTQVFLDNVKNPSGDVSAFIDTWDDSSNTALRGTMLIHKVSAKENYAVYTINGAVVNGTGYRKVPVAFVSSNGSFAVTDELSVLWVRTGDVGATGATGATGASGAAGAGAWRGTWATATSYLVLDAVAGASGAGLGKSYVCKSAHTSGATTEPGVGASWTTVWDLLADKGATGAQGPSWPGGSETTLTIATGSVTPTIGGHSIDTEAAAATDDLTNIVQTNLPDGSLLIVRCVSAARAVVVKHSAGGVGQISLVTAGDFTLGDPSHWLLLKRTGALWEEIARFPPSMRGVISTAVAYTIVAADLAKLIDCTSGTFTVSVTASATLGKGWWVAVKNSGTGVITLDPNAAETIDGAATLALAAGDSCQVYCNGSELRTVSKSPAAIVSGTGSANRVSYWSSASILTSSANLQFDGTTLTASAIAQSATVGTFSLQAAQADATQPTYSFVGATNTGMYRTGGGALGFATAGVKRAEINSSGNTALLKDTVGVGIPLILKNSGQTPAAGNGSALSFYSGRPGIDEYEQARIAAVGHTVSDDYLAFYTRDGNILSERVRIAHNGPLVLGSSAYYANLSGSKLVLGNAHGIYGSNAANNGNIHLLELAADNNLYVCGGGNTMSLYIGQAAIGLSGGAGNRQVTAGAADSGGAGFRYLRVPN